MSSTDSLTCYLALTIVTVAGAVGCLKMVCENMFKGLKCILGFFFCGRWFQMAGPSLENALSPTAVSKNGWVRETIIFGASLGIILVPN